MSNNQPLFNLSGRWDQRIDMTDASNPKSGQVLWAVTPEVASQRLVKLKPSTMFTLESDSLWGKVTDAIVSGDQHTATDEKANIEQAQREAAAIRTEKGQPYVPKLFAASANGGYVYKWFNNAPWNSDVEDEEFEAGGIISSRKRN